MRFAGIPLSPSKRVLRQFAACCAVFGSLWCFYLVRQGSAPLATTVGVLAATVALVGLLAPHLLRWPFVAAVVVTFPLAWVVTNVVLALLFFGMFTPIAIAMRLVGRDALRLKKPPMGTLWIERPANQDPKSYFRQF